MLQLLVTDDGPFFFTKLEREKGKKCYSKFRVSFVCTYGRTEIVHTRAGLDAHDTARASQTGRKIRIDFMCFFRCHSLSVLRQTRRIGVSTTTTDTPAACVTNRGIIQSC